MHYYLSTWESFTDVDGGPSFRPTVAGSLLLSASWTCIDLRSDPTKSAGYALLASSARPLVDPLNVTYLGENLDATPTVLTRREMESRIGLPRDVLSGTYRQIIGAILTQWGTEDGVRWRPLKQIQDTTSPVVREIFLGGERIWSQARG